MMYTYLRNNRRFLLMMAGLLILLIATSFIVAQSGRKTPDEIWDSFYGPIVTIGLWSLAPIGLLLMGYFLYCGITGRTYDVRMIGEYSLWLYMSLLISGALGNLLRLFNYPAMYDLDIEVCKGCLHIIILTVLCVLVGMFFRWLFVEILAPNTERILQSKGFWIVLGIILLLVLLSTRQCNGPRSSSNWKKQLQERRDAEKAEREREASIDRAHDTDSGNSTSDATEVADNGANHDEGDQPSSSNISVTEEGTTITVIENGEEVTLKLAEEPE